jgi:hypothetical protein
MKNCTLLLFEVKSVYFETFSVFRSTPDGKPKLAPKQISK